MSAGAWLMVLALVIALGGLALVVFALVRSIHNESTAAQGVWQEFGFGLSLMVVFFGTWIAHGIAEWQVFTDEQSSHGESTSIGDFVSQFGQSTFENWQSEFLQLFAFVALSALFLHKGSAESKDSDEKLEASLRRIETHLGTLPPDAPAAPEDSWRLPDAPFDIEAQSDEEAKT
jgi:hypothetical protein